MQVSSHLLLQKLKWTREAYLKCEIRSQEKIRNFLSFFFFNENLEKQRVGPKFRLIHSRTNTESHGIARLKFLHSPVTNKCSREKPKSKSHWLDRHWFLKRCYLQRISINWFAWKLSTKASLNSVGLVFIWPNSKLESWEKIYLQDLYWK